MSNPAVAPTVPFSLAQDFPPLAEWDFLGTEDHRVLCKAAKSLPAVVAILQQLDVEVRSTIVIPKQHTVCPQAFQSPKDFLALAKKGKLAARVSSHFAFEQLKPLWRNLPDSMRSDVADYMRAVSYVDGGAEFSLGRLLEYAPLKGIRNARMRPPSAAEAALALRHNGVNLDRLPAHAYKAYPLIAREGERTVRGNPKAGTGFPVCGRSNDAEAMVKVSRLAVTVRKEVVQAALEPGGVWGWLRKAEAERPWLVTLQGKAKADYYKRSKVESKQMRFYNTFPKQMMLNMQLATQPLEDTKQSVFTSHEVHSTVGISLTRGGAAELVAALESQLKTKRRGAGMAYVHCGDDTWIVYVTFDGRTLWFALDCSSFDLTQHDIITKPLHQSIHRELVRIDKPAGDLWYSYMRERQVVVALTVNVKTKHWGTSGAPLQSLVNGCLMDVACQRLERNLAAAEESGLGLDEELVEGIVHRVGESLGLRVRLEQFKDHGVTGTLRGILQREKFLFIGYQFYAAWDGHVAVHCDLPRQATQFRFPTTKWLAKGQEFQVMEAMRCGSSLINWGVFTPDLEPAVEAMRTSVLAFIDETIARYGDVVHPSLRWAVTESPFGLETLSSLSGLRAALARDPRVLWLHPEPELPSISVLEDIPFEGGDWADDDLEEEQAAERARLGLPPRPEPLLRLPAAASATSSTPSTHPPRWLNAGRPPPTAVWLPDRPPAPRRPTRSEGWARRAQVLEDDDPEEYYRDQDNRDDRPYPDDDDFRLDEAPRWRPATLEEWEEQNRIRKG